MAGHVALRPLRFPVTVTHGGIRAVLVAAVADVTGTSAAPDHGIAIALISVFGGLVVMLIQLWLSNLLRKHGGDRGADHDEEQHEIHDRWLEHMMNLEEENERLKAQLKRRRRDP